MKKTIGMLLLAASSACLSAHAEESSPNTPSDGIQVGSYYQGGVIYWLDPKKSYQHGLIVDINDAPDAAGYAWDTRPPSKTNATGDQPYAGKTNTQDIITTIDANRAHAASACLNSHNQGYNDWYLPAKKELTLMLGQGALTAKIVSASKSHGGSAFTHRPYWSSTEFHKNSAWNVTGGSSVHTATYKKNLALGVRCVRAF